MYDQPPTEQPTRRQRLRNATRATLVGYMTRKWDLHSATEAIVNTAVEISREAMTEEAITIETKRTELDFRLDVLHCVSYGLLTREEAARAIGVQEYDIELMRERALDHLRALALEVKVKLGE